MAAQKKEIITFLKKDGTTQQLEFKLRNYNGKNIFPDDGKEYIEGRNLKDEKVRLEKREIQEIVLEDGSTYIVLSDSVTSYIGYFATEGKLDIFQTYPYGRTTFYNTFGPTTTINKTASLAYLEVTNNGISLINSSKKLKELSNQCPELKNYVKEHKVLRQHDYVIEAFKFFNELCQ